MERIRFEGPAWDGHDENGEWVERKGWKAFFKLICHGEYYGFHGGDEYGNCTLFFQTPLFGVVWWYPTGHYQTEVKLPDPGVNSWVDKVYYGEGKLNVQGKWMPGKFNGH